MSKTFLFQAIQTVLIQPIQFSIRIVFVHTQLNVKTILFQVIQLSISTQFSSIWFIDRTLSGATTLGQSGPGSNGNEGVLRISQSSSITGTSPSDCLVSYTRHLLGVESLPLYRNRVSVFYSPSQLGTLETCCHSNSNGKPSAHAGVKNSNKYNEKKEKKKIMNCWHNVYKLPLITIVCWLLLFSLSEVHFLPIGDLHILSHQLCLYCYSGIFL